MVALMAYAGVGRVLLGAGKYRNRRGLVAWASTEIRRQWLMAERSADAVTWLPGSPSGRRERGYDLGQLVARRLGRDLGLPVSALLVRDRADTSQAGRGELLRGVGPSLRPTRNVLVRAPPRVLLVDDVSTTGASLSVAAQALRVAGCHEVHAAVVARTPKRSAKVPS